MTPIKLLGISGSLRRQSCNSGLLRAAAERLPDGVTLNTADLADLPFANAFAGAFDADGNLTDPPHRRPRRPADAGTGGLGTAAADLSRRRPA